MILVRFQSLLLLSNSFIIHVTDNFNHSQSSCVPFVRIAHIIFLNKLNTAGTAEIQACGDMAGGCSGQPTKPRNL